MERFFDGTDQENSKTQGGKGQFRKIHPKKKKKKGKNGGKQKKRFSYYVHNGGSHTRVFSIGQEHPSGYRPCATLPQESLP
jgi:hypothetical protein